MVGDLVAGFGKGFGRGFGRGCGGGFGRGFGRGFVGMLACGRRVEQDAGEEVSEENLKIATPTVSKECGGMCIFLHTKQLAHTCNSTAGHRTSSPWRQAGVSHR